MFNMFNKKYKLTHLTKKVYGGHTLHQIKALKSFGDVKKGDLGGWVEDYNNLSQLDTAWIYDNAMVWGNAKVCDKAKIRETAKVLNNAWVFDNAQVYGDATVSGHACIYGNAKVYGDSSIQGQSNIRENDEIKDNGSYLIFNNVLSSFGQQFVYVLSNHRWHVGCFDGTSDELIKRGYSDSEKSGKIYEMYVNFAEQVAKEVTKL